MSNLIFAQAVETALAGNGGGSNTGANGGAVSAGDINSGGNIGGAVGVGDSVGQVAVAGTDYSNATSLGIGANAGSSISDASGGEMNVAFVS
ncbi:MAG: hypothetical protein ACKOWF_07560 [Chloroflexota bacterium]